MLIKRVAIHGFKTFAKRTEFIFDPGVTAIVGPNGSGKSNIVDAIRWCLGEQSFSLLRSKKTSDVIFSGSDQKARLGMAQVTLTLDNSAGELPVDFTEIEVTRRAYRDGDNEYLLNGQRVRLQDITDLLAQTGLGRRTYALIGQGLIDKVLSLAPEELRSLFEEAAGITGYQAKRATTIRRLDAAQDNLTRVRDILDELTPRLSHLRKQADRAHERAQLAADLRNMLRDWYGYHWHTTLAALTASHHTVEQLNSKVATNQERLADLTAQIAAQRSQQTTLRAQLGEAHRAGSHLHRDAEQIGRELAVGQERLRQLHARQEDTQRELAPLQQQVTTAQARLAAMNTEVEQAHHQHIAQAAIVTALQTDLEQQSAARRRAQETVTQARRQLEQAQQAHTDANSRLRQLHERAAALATEQAGAAEALTAAAADAATWTAHADQHAGQLTDLEQSLAAAQDALAALHAQRETARRALAAAQQQRQEAERSHDRLQTRLDLLARLQNEGAGYASGVRAVLQAARNTGRSQPALPGIVGTVADQVRVPAHLDKALETALGGALQNVITRTWADTQRAIDWLKQTSSGRATFLPLDRLSALPAIPAPQYPGVLGNAADLVDYDPTLEDAVQQLLNRTWVVDTLTTARRALDNIRQGPRPTVVTLDGDIVRPGGAVTGGSDTSRRDDSILARARELRDLPAQVRQAADEVAQRHQAIRDLSTADEELARATVLRQEEVAALTRRERDLRSQVEDTTRKLDRARQLVQWQTERQTQLTAEMAATADLQRQLTTQLTDLAAAQTAAQTALTAAETTLAAAGADDLLRRLADERAAAAQAQAAWQNRVAARDLQQRALDTLHTQIAAKTQQATKLAQDEQALTQRLGELAAREADLSRAIADLQAEIAPAEFQLTQLEAALASLQQQERQAQEQLRRDESAWNTAQLHDQRTDDHLRQLRHDIEQDLGLVLLEVGEDLAYQPPLPWDSVVEHIPPRTELPDGLEEEIRELRARLSRVNNVNPDAPREYAEAAERHGYLLTQSADLEAAIADLRKIVRELDEVMRTELGRTFAAVAEQFVHFFQQLFNGGTAKLVLATPDDIANSGIEIIARPPGKRPQSLALLSGGERTLTACALIFAILRVSPTPFCVLDEVDAALDEANVDRFRQTIEELSRGTQFILITHNRRTLEGTNAIYGITMSGDGTSRVISLRLDGNTIAHRENPSGTAAPDGSDSALSTIEELVKL